MYGLDFFQTAHPPIPRGGGRTDHTELSPEMKNLLARVTKNKSRAQKASKRRRKSEKR